MWCWHKWSKWEIFEDRDYGYTKWIIRRSRICDKCGKKVVKEDIT